MCCFKAGRRFGNGEFLETAFALTERSSRPRYARRLSLNVRAIPLSSAPLDAHRGQKKERGKEMKKVIMFTISLVVVFLLYGGPSWATAPRNGLVAEYLFDGNANDSSGNGYNGTVQGATLITDRFGRTNAAYSFNGISN